MKKSVVILLLLIYGFTTMGATIHLHYCMNEFVGWSLFDGEDKTCINCGMEEKDKGSCCKDEHKHFKLKTDHQKSNASQYASFIAAPALAYTIVDFKIIACSTVITETYTTLYAPPRIYRKRLHILNRVFLI